MAYGVVAVRDSVRELTVWRKDKGGMWRIPAWWRPGFWRFVWRWRKRLRNTLVREADWYESAQRGGPDKRHGVFISLPRDDGTSASWDKDRIKQSIQAFRGTYEEW